MDYTSPGTIDCKEKCDVPFGTVMIEVPVPRHAWTDVLVCPNEGCDRAFLCRRVEKVEGSGDEE